jgi:hypothetical protein
VLVVPMLNPDAAVYIEENFKTNGNIKKIPKNRKDTSCLNQDSIGVDLRHNFDQNFPTFVSDPCAENYPGPTPESENETQALRKFFESQSNVSASVYFFSGAASQAVLIPSA